MEDPTRANPQNLLTTLKCLEQIRTEINKAIDDTKKSPEFLNQLLQTNMTYWQNNPINDFINTQLQTKLIEENVLPERPLANEDWDY
jgi:uncharacterized protein with ATP-grasp and redox domains